MKKTIKQWCIECGINWYGQGNVSMIVYDWKLAFGAGKSAIFSSMIDTKMPKIHTINGKEIYVFPNVNPSKNNGKISKDRFNRMIDWVQQCLEGNISDFSKIE